MQSKLSLNLVNVNLNYLSNRFNEVEKTLIKLRDKKIKDNTYKNSLLELSDFLHNELAIWQKK